jgi:Flp pilus assembly protein TadB
MNTLRVLGAFGIGAGCAAVAAIVRPATRRLAPRVRPYAIVARSALGHPPEPLRAARVGGAEASTLPRLFGPPLRAMAARVSALFESRTDDHLAKLLRQAGAHGGPDDFRVRQLGRGVMFAVGGGAVVAITLRTPVYVLVAAVAGFAYGASRVRRALERAVQARAAQLRLELYTVNHMLAMHVRTGAGAMQAVQRVVLRARGAVAEELADVVTWTRSGMPEGEAFRHAAELTPEPSAARTYQLLAAGVERGVDLASGLLALSEDIRDARREQLHKEAVKRRAAMLVPTIAILAPIMLLFIAAPLPSIVLGHH